LIDSLYFKLAEVPGAAWVNMQPAEHLCPSGFRDSGPQAQGWEGGSNLHQNLPWTGRNVRVKFHQDRCRGLDFHLPSTYQQTDKQTSVHPFLYI